MSTVHVPPRRPYEPVIYGGRYRMSEDVDNIEADVKDGVTYRVTWRDTHADTIEALVECGALVELDESSR